MEEFLRRVGEREGVNADTARNHASAVMTVLREAVTSGQLDDIRAQLPQEFTLFLNTADSYAQEPLKSTLIVI